MQEEILNDFNNSMISWKIRLINEKERTNNAEIEEMLKTKKMHKFSRQQRDWVGRSTLKDSSANMRKNSELPITKNVENVDTVLNATSSLLPLNKTKTTLDSADSTPEISDWGIKIVETMSLATNAGGDSTEPSLFPNTEAMDLMEIATKLQATDGLTPSKIRIKNPASINSSIPKHSLPPIDVPETETGSDVQDFSPITNQESEFISTESHSKKVATLSKQTLTGAEMPKQDAEISSSEALLDLTGFEVPKSCSPNIKQKRKNKLTVRGDLNDSIYLKTLDVQKARWTPWTKVNQVNPKRRVRKNSHNVSHRYKEYCIIFQPKLLNKIKFCEKNSLSLCVLKSFYK